MLILALICADCVSITHPKTLTMATAYGSVEHFKNFKDPKAKSNYAFCSVYSGDDDESKEYYKGIITLGYTLKRLYPHIDRVLIVAPDVKEKLKYFQHVWTHIYYRPFMVFPSRLGFMVNEANFIYKLYIWTLTQYSKVIFLASDVLPVSNLLSIFDEIAPAAPIDTTYYRMGSKNTIFNSDLMLIEPSMIEFMSITHFIFNNYNVRDGVRQHEITNDMINQYYGDKINIMKLTTLFDNSQVVTTALGSSSNLTIRSIVVHFGNQDKPWISKTKGFAILWRSIATCAGKAVGLNICNENTEMAERLFSSIEKKLKISPFKSEEIEVVPQNQEIGNQQETIISLKDFISLLLVLLFGMLLLYKVLSIHHSEDPGFTVFNTN